MPGPGPAGRVVPVSDRGPLRSPAVDPAAIDLSFVPTQRVHVATLGGGGEGIVIDEIADRALRLSPTATLVWSFIDGVSSLEDFAVDLVDVLGLDPAAVRADVVELARDLGRRGLLDGVGPAPDVVASLRSDTTAIRRLTSPPSPRLDARFEAAGRLVSVTSRRLAFDLRTDDPALAGDLADALRAGGIDVSDAHPTGRGAAGGDAQHHAEPAADRSVDDRMPLYSVLASRDTGSVQTLNFLYRSARPVRRTRHRRDLVRIAVADVRSVLDREEAGRPLLAAPTLSRDGSIVIVDPLYSALVDDLERDLRRAGIERLDPSFVAVSPTGGGHQVAGFVLRPIARPEGHDLTPAAITVAAADLTRGIEGRIAPAAMAELLRAIAATPILRVPGRDGLRAAILALLS